MIDSVNMSDLLQWNVKQQMHQTKHPIYPKQYGLLISGKFWFTQPMNYFN